MMTTILLFLGMAFASDPIERPATPEPVKGECFKVVPINKGKPLSPVILDTDGIAKCSALAVPLSQFSDLLQTEQWGVAIQSQYKIETARLDMEIDWYKTKLEQANQPVPWVEKPATQRWLGRIETIVVVGIVTAGLGATYHYSSGVGQ
tara:strand:+ start:798 stop:1244 length:447 start_codon:yes stop_codon:yes gene_type:complete